MRHRFLQFEKPWGHQTHWASPRKTRPEASSPKKHANNRLNRTIPIRLFCILHTSHSFQHITASKWTGDKSFQTMKQIDNYLQFVNETAAHSVKVWHKLIGVTQDENRFQKTLHVVETGRKHVPNQRRLSGLSEARSWFLSINKEWFWNFTSWVICQMLSCIKITTNKNEYHLFFQCTHHKKRDFPIFSYFFLACSNS